LRISSTVLVVIIFRTSIDKYANIVERLVSVGISVWAVAIEVVPQVILILVIFFLFHNSRRASHLFFFLFLNARCSTSFTL
jgi:hypothetical protein